MSEITAPLGQQELLELVSCIPSGILVTDLGRRILWANEAVEDLLGYTLDEILGKHPARLFHGPKTDQGTQNYITQRVKRRQPFEVELVYYRRDGSSLWVRQEAKPLFERGEVARYVVAVNDITSRIESERALRESSSRARSLEDLQFDGTLTLEDGVIATVSPQICKLIGYSYSELVGEPVFKFIAFSHHALAKERLTTQLSVGQTLNTQTLVLHKNGTPIPIRARSQEIRQNGRLVRLIQIEDLSEQFQMEQLVKSIETEYKASEQRYERLIESHPDGLLLVQQDTVCFANRAAALIFGYASTEGIEAAHINDLLGEANFERLAGVSLKRRGKTTHPTSFTIQRPDGEKRDTEAIMTQVDYERAPAYQIVVRDVTESRNYQEKSHLLSQAMHAISDGVMITDLQGRIRYVNDALLDTFEYAHEKELVGRHFSLLHPEGVVHKISMKSDHGWRAQEHLFKRRGGQIFPVEVTVDRVQTEGEVPVALIYIMRDITAEKQKQRQLSDYAEQIRLAHDAANLGSFTYDFEARELVLPPETQTLLGVNRSVLSWEKAFDYIDPDYHGALTQAIDDACKRDNGHFAVELRTFRDDGSALVVFGQGTITFRNEKPYRGRGVIMDITGDVKIQQQIESTERRYRQFAETIEDAAAEFYLSPPVSAYTIGSARADVLYKQAILRHGNKTMATVLGTSDVTHTLGVTLEDLLTDEAWASQIKLVLKEFFDNSFSLSGRITKLPVEGEERIFSVSVHGNYDPAKQHLESFWISLRDITEIYRLTRKVNDVASDERKRLKQDLHDGALQHMYFTGAVANKIAVHLKRMAPESVIEKCREIHLQSDLAYQKGRVLLGYLSPVGEGKHTLRRALQNFADYISTQHELPTALVIQTDQLGRIPTEDARQIHEIVRQAGLNAVKHAAANRLSIAVTESDGHLHFRVADDGDGFDPEDISDDTFGCESMTQRAHLIGTVLEILSERDSGTIIAFDYPLRRIQKKRMPNHSTT